MGKMNRNLRELLEAARIKSATEVRPLGAEDIDHLLQSAGLRCVHMSRNHGWARWVTPSEINEFWLKQVRPNLDLGQWSGWYEVAEWRTDQDELIIVFVHTYAAI